MDNKSNYGANESGSNNGGSNNGDGDFYPHDVADYNFQEEGFPYRIIYLGKLYQATDRVYSDANEQYSDNLGATEVVEIMEDHPDFWFVLHEDMDNIAPEYIVSLSLPTS